MVTVANNQVQYLGFQGLEAPVRLTGAAELLPVIRRVLPSWPFTLRTGIEAPQVCMDIAGTGTDTYLCQAPDAPTPRSWGAVNAVCEMVVALAWEQIRCNPLWLCLHCAAVEFNGRLVLFPNRRRAGKSTLTAALAARGFRVFTDDFLPVSVDDAGRVFGHANGIAPRLRLPLPEQFSADFRTWVDRHTGPENGQYAFLEIDDLAPRGAMLPIGAVVVLDRDDDAADAQLHGVSAHQVLDDLISQNFARILHSGRILRASQGVAETAQTYRLRYASAEDAVDGLAAHFDSWQTPVRPIPHAWQLPTDGADLRLCDTAKPVLSATAVYRRAAGVAEVEMDNQYYVSDGSGIGIHRLNPGSGLIWRILEEPASLDDIIDVLSAAFPDIPARQIRSDSLSTLRQFVEHRLIEPAAQDAALTA